MKETENKKTTAKKAVKKPAKVEEKTLVKEDKKAIEPAKECSCCAKRYLIDEYVDVLGAYAKFSGRLSRRGYWGFVLFNTLFAGLCWLMDLSLSTKGLLFLTYGFLTLLPSYAAVARRLHDVNRSMWWEMIPLIIVPVLLQVAGLFDKELMNLWKGTDDVLLALTFISLIMCYFLCYFLLKRGSEGENKYGEKPYCK